MYSRQKSQHRTRQSTTQSLGPSVLSLLPIFLSNVSSDSGANAIRRELQSRETRLLGFEAQCAFRTAVWRVVQGGGVGGGRHGGVVLVQSCKECLVGGGEGGCHGSVFEPWCAGF